MKNAIILVIALFSFITATAQDYEALKNFQNKYGLKPFFKENSEQIGKPMPDFHFNEQLNSNALRGRFVVLNFWATWCGGCRLLSHDLDSLMIKATDDFKDVQLIGVNSKERLVDKGYKAAEWWKSQKLGYPTTEAGKAADECDESIRAGHPTALLIDDKGIIRGRWDAWSTNTAAAIRFVTWVLHVLPEKRTEPNIDNVNQLMKNGQNLEALYLLEMMPTTTETSVLKFKAIIDAGQTEIAIEYLVELQKQFKGTADYMEMMKSVAKIVLESEKQSTNLLKVGQNIAFEILSNNGGKDYKNYEVAGSLRWLYGESLMRDGLSYIKSGIRIAEENNADSTIVAKLKKRYDEYKSSTENVKIDKNRKRMIKTYVDENAHKQTLTDHK